MSKKDLPIDLMMKSVDWKPVEHYQESSDGLPTVTHEGVLYLEGLAISCYQLDNGQSVMNSDDIEKFFETDEK